MVSGKKKRSCLSQLLEYYQTLVEALENREIAEVIYLDFAKAFDKVDHGVLMRKLRKQELVVYSLNGSIIFCSTESKVLS